ncbi:MAG: putative SAM-dependent methyltransferase [Myxococcaceae bacterium]|nr:putative SAM-dependent methyltransferase [Myxococcaceae bacterium]
MPRAFTLLERVDTPEGPLELRQSGPHFMITIGARVLMSSQLTRSETAVAKLGCEPIRTRPQPRVLIGGLGLGFTLRAALDMLPQKARVEVAELNPVVERWCRGPLAILTHNAVADRRVQIRLGDVTRPIRDATARYDAIILDLYLGPQDPQRGQIDPLYGLEILTKTHAALTASGVYAVWSEEPNKLFEERLRRVGFSVQLVRPQGGGPRHAVYLASKKS